MEALARIEDKLDKITEHLNVVDLTLVRQADQLGEHMRRTAALEGIVAPLVRAHAAWAGVGKALAVLGTLSGALAGLSKLLHMF